MKAEILIVEDSNTISHSITNLLLKNDYQVCNVFVTGEEAVNYIKENTPDLILMDINLAGEIDGIQATQKIKKIKAIPIIYLTVSKNSPEFERAKKTRANAYLVKDSSLNHQLLLTIEFVLENSKKNRLLEESEEKFRKIAETTNNGIVMLNNKGEIIFWNLASENIFGYSQEEILGENFHQIFVPEHYYSDYEKAFEKFQKTGNGNAIGKTLLVEAYRKNGELFPVELSLSALQLNGEWNSVGLVNDITQRVKYENQLKESNSTKDKFFSIIAHDLINPISAFKQMTKMLSDDFDAITIGELKEILKAMKSTSSLLYQLLDNLLNWSRAQTGKIQYNPDNFDISMVVAENLEVLKLQAEKKKIELINEVPKDTFAFFDRNMISTVIRNLLSNSIKFTNENGLIKVFERPNDTYLQIVVEDNGVGMSAEVQVKIFKIDESFTNLGTNDEKGTGLGVILCKEFMNYHNGNLSVESEVGIGSKFIISIPKSN